MISASEFLKWLEVFNVQFGSNTIPIPVPLALGGTGANLTATNNSLVYSTSSALALLATNNNSVLVTSSGGVPSLSTTLPSNLITTDPTLAQGLATKHYVDQNSLTGTSVYATTTTNLNVTQAGAGIGATITDNSGTFAVLTLDGVAVPLNANFLYKNSAAPQHEGIYKLTTNGDTVSVPWQGTRATTYDTPIQINNTGLIIVQNGNTLAGTAWYNATTIVTVDTTAFNYNQFGNIIFPVSLANGGTNANLTASNGGIFYSTATAGAILAGTATANQIILSGASGAPSWSTATYPSTTTINQLLYSSSANVIAGLATLNNGVLITGATGIPAMLANGGSPGMVLTTNTGAPPSWQTLAFDGAITQIDADLGNGTPSSGIMTISGGSTGLETSASLSTITITGTLNLGSGGTNNSLMASAGGVVWSDASKLNVLSGTATAGQLLLSGSATSPSWSTTTYPNTNAINTIMYASSANVLSSMAAVSNAVLVTSTGGVPSLSTTLPAGLTIPGYQTTITFPLSLALGGTNANITPAAGAITYSTSGGLALSAAGSAGQLLASAGTSSPVWTTNTYPSTDVKGDLLYASATNTISGLGIGSTGQILTIASGLPSWSTATYPSTTTVNQLLYSSSTNVVGGISTVGNGVLITSNAGIPSWLANSGIPGYVLTANTGAPPSWQSITAEGAITSVNGDTGSASPTAGAITISGGGTGLTTSGTASTLSLTGVLNLASGGTNHGLTASNGGIVYSDASKLNILSGTATATQMLQSGSSTTPAWSTSTWPATTTINQLLYSSAANTVTGLATVTTAVLTTASGVPTWAAQLSLALGGTNASLTAAAGAVAYSSASAIALTAVGSSGQLLSSAGTGTPVWTSNTFPVSDAKGDILYASATNTIGGLAIGSTGQILTVAAGLPAWSTATYPATTTINQLLYSSSANVVSGISVVNSSGLLTNGSGVPAWVAYTGTGAPVLGTSPTITTPKIVTGINDVSGNVMLAFSPQALAVNYISIFNNVTGAAPVLAAVGADTDVTFQLNAKGAGAINLFANTQNFYNQSTQLLFNIANVASAVNYLSVAPNATGFSPSITATGSDSNVGMNLVAKGTGSFAFTNAGGAVNVFNLAGVASGVNYISVSNNILGASPFITMLGTDTNIALDIKAKGDGAVNIYGNGVIGVKLYAPPSAVNYVLVEGSVTNTGVNVVAQGTDSNIDINIISKGTGGIVCVSNSHVCFTATSVGTAVNYVGVNSSATGVAVGMGLAGSDSNITMNISAKGTGRIAIQGISTNTAAAAGFVGEFMSASNLASSPITFSTGVAKTLQSVTLTAGDWDVWGNIFASATTITSAQCSLHTVNNTMADNSLISYNSGVATGSAAGMIAPQRQFIVSGSTTIYLVGVLTGSGTISCSGGIYARRRS